MKTAKFVTTIKVKDPDQFGSVEISVYKHENGGMFAVDSSYLDQVARTDEDDNLIIPDPFCDVEDQFDIVTLVD
jgi:hypothetical protein